MPLVTTTTNCSSRLALGPDFLAPMSDVQRIVRVRAEQREYGAALVLDVVDALPTTPVRNITERDSGEDRDEHDRRAVQGGAEGCR